MGKWIWQDYVILLSILLNLGARFLTIFITTNVHTLATTSANLEANPVGYILSFNIYIQFAFGALLYAILIVLYLYVKNLTSKNRDTQQLAMNLLVITILMVFAADFVNDLAIASAVLW